MSSIRGKNTKPELLVRRFLHLKGFRYRLHVKELPGKPDIVLPKYKTAVFVHGCFWHSHSGCKDFVIPKSNVEWWKEKLAKTVIKDRENKEKLESDNWRIIEVWECDLKKQKRASTLQHLINFLKSINGGSYNRSVRGPGRFGRGLHKFN